uniref:Uncharacterized protein n=1 Tax=Timema shepardi TaxID=629360 RepID=A0A7R9FYK3_TIMSH|nr:unnamed protein product [Timema shepardi]
MPPISRPSSSTYWAPHATVIRHRPFSELPPYNSLNTADEPFSCNASVLSTSNNSSRQYVDPWDLENYAFIKRHCPVDDVETDYLTSTPALESSQSDFYYMPNYPEDHARYQPDSLLVTDETSGHFAGIEEEDFYNERFEMFNNCSPHLSSSDGYGGYPSPGISPFTPASCLSPKTTDVGDSNRGHRGDIYVSCGCKPRLTTGPLAQFRMIPTILTRGTLVVLSSTAEDGEIEVRISVG